LITPITGPVINGAPHNGSQNWWRPPKMGPHIKGGPLISQWLQNKVKTHFKLFQTILWNSLKIVDEHRKFLMNITTNRRRFFHSWGRKSTLALIWGYKLTHLFVIYDQRPVVDAQRIQTEAWWLDDPDWRLVPERLKDGTQKRHKDPNKGGTQNGTQGRAFKKWTQN